MQFPHLSDTQFPNLSTVNVYRFRNTFDYTRWNENTIVKLCNVLWNSDYYDVVKFDTDEERDAYFDSIDDYWALELETAARIVPEGFVKLPVPYDVAARYNYLFIDMPIATGSDNLIDYENPNGIRRWYFFIDRITYLSPNATQVTVLPDIWTNYQNSVEINYMLLERGHAPVAASDVNQYLANPIANNRYLLAPDVNFDNASINRNVNYVPFGNGEKYVCIASTCKPNNLSDLGTVTVSSDYNENGSPVYSNTADKWGYQLEVSGLSIGNGHDYSNAKTLASMGASNGNRIANNLTVYAIAATEMYGSGTFFDDVMFRCPQFLNTVQGCFVVSAECLTLGSAHTLVGHTLYECVGVSRTLLTKQLTVQDFDYPSELQRFAKLYTSPYAKIEITDNDGNTHEINIEETSTLKLEAVVSLAFPYINMRVFLDGVGGTGKANYYWRDLAGSNNSMQISNSDWFKYCFDWKIPTFALYMDGGIHYQLTNFNRSVKNAIRQAVVNYHVSQRSSNIAYENACSEADVARSNADRMALVARTNAFASADTGKTNSDNTTRAGYTNAGNSAGTTKTNAYNSADLGYTVTDRNCTNNSTNLNLANAGTATNEEYGIAGSDEITYLNNQRSSNAVYFANRILYYTTDAEIQKSTATNVGSSVGMILGGALNGGMATSNAGAQGIALGAVMGALGGAINAAVNTVNLGITTNTAQEISDAQADYNSNINAATVDYTSDIQDQQDATRRNVYRNNATVASNQMDNSNATARANASDTRNTAKTNADNSYNTAITNAGNTANAAYDNATNTQTTSRNNAENVYTNTLANTNATNSNRKGNAGDTREVATLNAKELLENSLNTNRAAIADSRNQRPIEYGSYSGNADADYYMTRGIQLKVKTQSDSAIRQAGDTFARYGYALNQIWNVQQSGLKLMEHFTYWKATEIWVDDREASNNFVQDAIQNMFLSGVTVWNDPEEIGRVNVYDN